LGAFSYDAAKDVLRVKAKPQTVMDSQEFLTYSIDTVTEDSANVNLRWEKIWVPFTVKVPDVTAKALAHLRTVVAAAKPTDAQTPSSAAMYAKNNKATDDAAKWFEQANKAIDEQIKAKPSFATYRQKANILINAGRLPEAYTAAEKAIELGKADSTVKPADVQALEKRIADLKAPKN